jgi:hypothetical protein
MASVLGGNLAALALSDEQIVKVLDSTAVFVITNEQGSPLSRTLNGQNGQNAGAVTQVFMSRKEAEAFVSQLRSRSDVDPKMKDMLKNLQVTAVPLGAIYKQVRQTANQPNRLVFAFKPVQQEVDGAMTLLRQSGQQVKEFNGVPVFAVRFGPDKGYVPIKLPNDNKEMVPLFLSKQDALSVLNQVKQKFPAADIQVIDVEGVIQTLREKNDPWLNQVVLVPSPEVREFIRTMAGSSPQAAPNQPRRANQAQPRPANQAQPRQTNPSAQPAPQRPQR